MQTLTPISSPSSISQPEWICVRYASYSARPFTVTIAAWSNQLKLKIKSHLILPEQPPQPECVSERGRALRNKKGRMDSTKSLRERRQQMRRGDEHRRQRIRQLSQFSHVSFQSFCNSWYSKYSRFSLNLSVSPPFHLPAPPHKNLWDRAEIHRVTER